MRVFSGQVIATRNRHEDGPNVSAYVSAAGVDDPARIEFRDLQLLAGSCGVGRHSWFVAGDQWSPGGDYFCPPRGVAIAACSAEQVVANLGASYTSVTFWMQLRVSEDSIENPQLYAPQRITVDGAQEESTTIDGTATIIGVEKRDSAGLRVRFEYHAALTGIQPLEFVLAKTSGTGTIADVSVALSAAPGPYTVDVSGLTDAAAYTFTLTAKNGATEKLLATINFTADGDGGGAVESLTAAAC